MTAARDHVLEVRTNNKASEPIRESVLSLVRRVRGLVSVTRPVNPVVWVRTHGGQDRTAGGVRPKVKSGSNAQLKSQGPKGLHAAQRKMSEGAKMGLRARTETSHSAD